MILKRLSLTSSIFASFAQNIPCHRNQRAVTVLRVSSLLLLCALFLGTSPSAWSQDDGPNPSIDQGIKPYQTVSGGDIDSVNMSSGNLVVHIPIASYPQRGGKLKLSYSLIYNARQFGTTKECEPNKTGSEICHYVWGFEYNPWQIVADGIPQLGGCQIKTGLTQTLDLYDTCRMTASDGSAISFGQISSGAYRALDGSGWQILWNGTSTGLATIIDKEGTQYSLNAGTIQDSSGNVISKTTDTLGRTFSPATSTTDFSGCTGADPTSSASIWALPGMNGGTYAVKLCYATYAVVSPGAFTYYGTAYSGNQSLLQSIVLPNGTTYQFSYDASADLASIVTPTGSTLTYTWASLVGCPNVPSSIQHTSIAQVVASRGVNTGDGSGTHTWTYNFGTVAWGSGTTSRTDTETDPLGNETVFTQTGLGNTCSFFETNRVVYQGLQSAGNMLETTATNYAWIKNTQAAYSAMAPYSVFNVHPTTVTTTLSNGQVREVVNQYDSGFSYSDSTMTLDLQYNAGYGLVTAKKEYDYGSGAPGALLRTTSTTYQALANPTYLSDNFLDLLSSVQVTNGTGTQVAYTTYGYDAYGLASSGITGATHGSSPPDGLVRGNQTSVSKWLNTSGGYLTSTATYFDTGEVNIATDPKGNTATFAYSTVYQGAYPTTVTNALGQSTTHTYDFNTGRLLSTSDLNSQLTSYTYDPETWRKIQTAYPDGGQLSYCYSDTASEGCTAGPPYEVVVTKKISSSQNLVETGIVDGLGRLSETELNSDPAGVDYSIITYDADGRKASETNPYRTTSDATYGMTTYQYDALNRPTLVTKPDGSTVTTSYTGNCTTVTDEAGKTRESCADGLGRMTEVIENPGGLNFITNYTYDALDDLVSVAQGSSRNRSFVYDSLKRLTSSGNPETGGTTHPVTYTYDANSNVQTKTDARGIVITYSWDKLNRMLGRTYSNGDPSVSYVYDQTACVVVASCYNIGHMTTMTDAAGSDSFAYDKVGRLWGDQRTTAGITKNSSYAYNLDGSLNTLTYPSGHSVYSAVGGAGLPLTTVDSAVVDYVSSGMYTPWGAHSYSSLGLKMSESILYNKRLQPCWTYGPQNLTATSCTASYVTGTYIDLKYNFNLGADNGNLSGITNDRNSNRSQTYVYDAVNRITSAATLPACTATCWNLAFTLDQWANLTAVAGTGNATLTPNANNQISVGPFTYDASGNELTDVTSTYAWNAESEMKTGGGVTYLYDGRGDRVEKSGAKLYWYGPSGEVLDETDTTGSTTNAAFSEYIYFAGARIARRDYQNNVYYYFEDQVHSSRVIAEIPAGTTTPTLCYDADFYPYGGEIDFTNTCPQNYKFQGKERDAETGNDYFGARFYSSTYGRFLSPDWSSVPAPIPYANLANPQTLNLYAFVIDNPESFADLNGHDPGVCNSGGAAGYRNCPVASQGNAALQVAKDTIVGAAKEGANTVINLANLVNAPIDAGLAKLGINFSFGQGKDFEASTPGEKGAMIGTSLGLLIVPGAGEEKAAATASTSVYTIVKDGETVYAGITNNLARRAAEHGEALTEVASGLTRTQARGVEQALIEQHGLASNGGTLLNRINSIARSNPIYNEAVQFGRELLGSIGYH
jgi:RHS repeat-associated protein